MPVEIAGAIAFDLDTSTATYDAEQAHGSGSRWSRWTGCSSEFRSRFVGKSSPVHLFWGALDLAVTRFSGRPAPLAPRRRAELRAPGHARGVLPRGEQRRLLAGWRRRGPLLLLRLPEPDGFAHADIDVAGARYDDELGEFVLPYEAVRTAEHPDALLLEFLQATYEAAADLAGWDRHALERQR